jgi:hypothetical protein
MLPVTKIAFLTFFSVGSSCTRLLRRTYTDWYTCFLFENPARRETSERLWQSTGWSTLRTRPSGTKIIPTAVNSVVLPGWCIGPRLDANKKLTFLLQCQLGGNSITDKPIKPQAAITGSVLKEFHKLSISTADKALCELFIMHSSLPCSHASTSQ